jgi:hypothetical protein
MKLSLFTASLLLTGSLYGSGTHHVSSTQEGMHAIKLLGKTLKTQLKAKFQEDSNGTTAITFCTAQAQVLTQQVNEQLPSHVKVRRTSLLLRNPANQADATDIKIMKQYQSRISKKSSIAMLPITAKVGKVTRVYKPLVVGAVCLKCHGENVSPAIAKTIQASYPTDKAIGMKLGDFRGVIVAEVTKH